MADLDYDVVRECPPVDYRVVEEIEKNRLMLADQGSGFMSNYGGPSNYKAMSKMEEPHRLVFAAMLNGHSDYQDIADVTMLKLNEVENATKALEKKGYIKRQAVPADTTKKDDSSSAPLA